MVYCGACSRSQGVLPLFIPVFDTYENVKGNILFSLVFMQ